MAIKNAFMPFFMLIASLSFAQDNILSEEEVGAIEKIIQNQDSCVKAFDENKIYPTEKGMYLLLNEQNDYAFLSGVFSDEQGCFVKYPMHLLYGDPRIEIDGEIGWPLGEKGDNGDFTVKVKVKKEEGGKQPEGEVELRYSFPRKDK